MNIIAVIPARAGSKGIPNKNIYQLCGKPLIEWTIDAAKRVFGNNYVISTDGYHEYKNSIKRPYELCLDDVPMLPVVRHAVDWYEYYNKTKHVDAVMILQPTSPLRTFKDINGAILLFKEFNSDSLYSGYRLGIKTKDKAYDKHTTNPHFQRNGAIFITRRDLLDKGQLWSDNAIEFEMPKSRSIDIDDMDDMFMAESILKNLRGGNDGRN